MYTTYRESEERLLDDDTASETFGPLQRKKHSKHHLYLWVAQGILFLLTLSMLIKTAYIKSQTTCICEDHMPMWSPALKGVEGTGHYQRFDGSFATPNRFKGPPSPEIDAAWEEITFQNGGVISIDEKTLHAVNASADFSVKLNDDMGGGYMASVEALHQLHCLNMLRQASYWDYYKDIAEPWQDSPQTLRYHLDHCIDNLRQKLMCDADAGILTYVWVKDHPGPFPDFSVQHHCRSFDVLKDWVVEHQLFMEEGAQIQRMSGAKELESPP